MAEHGSQVNLSRPPGCHPTRLAGVVVTVAIITLAWRLPTPARAQAGTADLSGSYVLQRIDGREPSPVGPITGGWLEVNPDGRWTLRINWRGDLGSARIYG